MSCFWKPTRLSLLNVGMLLTSALPTALVPWWITGGELSWLASTSLCLCCLSLSAPQGCSPLPKSLPQWFHSPSHSEVDILKYQACTPLPASSQYAWNQRSTNFSFCDWSQDGWAGPSFLLSAYQVAGYYSRDEDTTNKMDKNPCSHGTYMLSAY